MGSGYAKKKKQAKALQEQFARMQEELANTEVEGSAGNGLVTIVLNGENEMKSIRIKPECVDPEDVEGLEDLIQAAYSDGLKRLQEASGGMASPAAGLGGGLPDLGALGF